MKAYRSGTNRILTVGPVSLWWGLYRKDAPQTSRPSVGANLSLWIPPATLTLAGKVAVGADPMAEAYAGVDRWCLEADARHAATRARFTESIRLWQKWKDRRTPEQAWAWWRSITTRYRYQMPPRYQLAAQSSPEGTT